MPSSVKRHLNSPHVRLHAPPPSPLDIPRCLWGLRPKSPQSISRVNKYLHTPFFSFAANCARIHDPTPVFFRRPLQTLQYQFRNSIRLSCYLSRPETSKGTPLANGRRQGSANNPFSSPQAHACGGRQLVNEFVWLRMDGPLRLLCAPSPSSSPDPSLPLPPSSPLSSPSSEAFNQFSFSLYLFNDRHACACASVPPHVRR
jgi:hypothetical protein